MAADDPQPKSPPTAAPGGTPGGGPEAAAAPAPAGKVQFRNVLVLTMCGVLLVLIWLLVSFFMGQAGDPKEDFRTDRQAPNYQTAPQNIPNRTAGAYLKRAREALNRKDIGACRMWLEDLTQELKQRPNLLNADEYKEYQALVEDFSAATGQPLR